MNPTQYEEFMERIRASDVAYACRYGHRDCSDRPGGDCCDEETPEPEAEYMPPLVLRAIEGRRKVAA
jgi:hypothetical protein